MGFFQKLFGKRQPPAPPQETLGDGAADNDLIRVYDAYGRQLMMRKEDWRESLLGNLEQAKDDPDALYHMITTGMNDGFMVDMVPYAEHLAKIDTDPARGAAVKGVVYLDLGRIDDAERTFRDHLNVHGENGYILSNLAKVQYRRGDKQQAMSTLWRALELDPNQENAFQWYWAEIKENDGEAASQEVLKKISRLPGSWLSQLWLARSALELKNNDEALLLYQQALASAPRPVPTPLLQQMTGDLGNHGQLVEALRLANPYYDPSYHGVVVGNNLIKANMELERISHAQELVDRLYALKRPDFHEPLAYWDTEIAKARIANQNDGLAPSSSMQMLTLVGPVWLPTSSPACELFPNAEKDAGAVVVCFLGSSSTLEQTKDAKFQMADIQGRISRALPLFLAEQCHLQTTAAAQVLQPWMSPGGLVLCGQPWGAEAAVEQAHGCERPGDYVVVTHLTWNEDVPTLEYQLMRVIDGSLLADGYVQADVNDLKPAYTQLAEKVIAGLCEHTAVQSIEPDAAYEPSHRRYFNQYQLRLEQLLAVRAAAMPHTQPEFLSGMREIVSGNIRLCLEEFQNTTTRLILVETLKWIREVKPQVVEEYREQIASLEQQSLLAEPAQTIVHGMFERVMGEES